MIIDQYKTTLLSHIWRVADITRHISNLLRSEITLQDIWVFGEVSNLAKPSSGHIYFTLKEEKAALKCVIWKTNIPNKISILNNGMLIEAHGSIGIYELNGVYQLYIDDIRPQGEGVLYLEFLRLKDKLENEGLFDLSRKRNLPHYPKVIGIITSTTGAAIRDVLITLKRRYPMANIFVYPTTVQGEEAVKGIKLAIEKMNQLIKPDVILLVRGGGSLEDLSPFNTEEVVRAISRSKSPLICGIGHETDFTLADFAADMRAATPTAAAELATPDVSTLFADIKSYQYQLYQILSTTIMGNRNALSLMRSVLKRYNPIDKINQQWQSLDYLRQRINNHAAHKLSVYSIDLLRMKEKVDLINPQTILQRGYSLVLRENGKIIHRSEEVSLGDKLLVHLSKGELGVSVMEKK